MLSVLLRAPVASHVSPCGHPSELYADVCCDHQSTSIAPWEQERRLARSFFKKVKTYLRRTWLFCRQEKNSRSKIVDIDYLKFHRHPSWNVVTGLQSTVEAELAAMYHPFTEHGMTGITRENGSDVLFIPDTNDKLSRFKGKWGWPVNWGFWFISVNMNQDQMFLSLILEYTWGKTTYSASIA